MTAEEPKGGLPPYHPIHDTWFLARCKYKGGIKRYGGYLGGFPERARVLIGCALHEPMLHVCGGHARLYPYRRGFGDHDMTLDLDPDTKPDFLADAREPLPWCPKSWGGYIHHDRELIAAGLAAPIPWPGVLIDPPYSEEDAAHYSPGSERYPKPNDLIKHSIDRLPVGRRVGIIHYIVPQHPKKESLFVAGVGIISGFNNRIRVFSVYERI